MPEAFPRGRFIWHELMTTDPDSAVPFYKKVVGWNVQSWEPDPTYRLWTMGDSPMGGLMPLPERGSRSLPIARLLRPRHRRDERRGMAAPIYHTADMVRAMPDDGNRYEVVYGELLVTPAPRPWHQVVVQRLR